MVIEGMNEMILDILLKSIITLELTVCSEVLDLITCSLEGSPALMKMP